MATGPLASWQPGSNFSASVQAPQVQGSYSVSVCSLTKAPSCEPHSLQRASEGSPAQTPSGRMCPSGTDWMLSVGEAVGWGLRILDHSRTDLARSLGHRPQCLGGPISGSATVLIMEEAPPSGMREGVRREGRQPQRESQLPAPLPEHRPGCPASASPLT